MGLPRFRHSVTLWKRFFQPSAIRCAATATAADPSRGYPGQATVGAGVATLAGAGVFVWFHQEQNVSHASTNASGNYSGADEYWQDSPRSAEWADRPGTNSYGDKLYGEKFKKYGYGVPPGQDAIYVHARSIPDTDERNLGSREALRVKAKDPKTLPLMTLEQVDKLSNEDGKTVVTFRGGVYDVTKFTKGHPGGDRIMMANGMDLEPYWEVYKLHFRPHIQHLVEDYRIGNLSKKDAATIRKRTKFDNTFVDEPARPRSVLRFASERPYNGGPRLQDLTKSFYTPNELHYTRNHAPVPRVDPEDYRLTIQPNPEIGLKGAEFTLEDLKTKFKPHAVSSTLQCAGGRQEDFVIPDRPLYVEAKWREEAWGTARWKGAKVRDILRHCGLNVDAMSLGQEKMCAKFLNTYAMDVSETGKPYGTFIPFAKAVDPLGDVIIAYEMNGVELPRDHGYPCRLLSPGTAGFRNTKWIEEMSVTVDQIGEDCDQKNQHFGPGISFRGHFIPGKNGEGPTPDLMNISAPRVCTVPVYSTICEPGMGQTVPGDATSIKIKGVAWSGAGRGINRVEVSIDGGRNFRPATLLKKPDEVVEAEPESSHGLGRCWTWQQWEIDFPLTQKMIDSARLTRERVEIEIAARARDGDFNVQPQSIEDSYNVLGKCVNHWPRRIVFLDPSYRTGDKNIPPMLPMPPAGQWVWRRHYPVRVDLDDPVRYNKDFERESVKLGTPTPPKSKWW